MEDPELTNFVLEEQHRIQNNVELSEEKEEELELRYIGKKVDKHTKKIMQKMKEREEAGKVEGEEDDDLNEE